MLLAGALVLAGSPTAAAHTWLIASDPQDGSGLAKGPSRVSATFNEDLQPAFAAMTVVGPDGSLWQTGDPEVRGPVASVGLRPLGPAGRYTVNYRVTAADGHVVSGSWSFTLTESTAPASTAPASTASASTGTAAPARAPESSTARVPLWPFAAGALVLVAGLALWAVRRRS